MGDEERVSVLNDKLIDEIANLCWHYQGERLKVGDSAYCICPALKDMVYLTKKNIEEENERKKTSERLSYIGTQS